MDTCTLNRGTTDKVLAGTLGTGDIISTFDGPYSHATVRKIDEDYVYLFRPYTQSGDFEYTGGRICYIGIEEYYILKHMPVTLIKKHDDNK